MEAKDVQRGLVPRFRFANPADAIAIVVLLLVGAAAALTFRDYGLGWDDYTHSQYGDLLLALFGSGFADRRALNFVNLYFYGGGFDMLAALFAKALPFDLFAVRRLTGAAVGIVGLVATWRMGRRISGPWSGLIALALLAACPLYYGHMFMNPKDAPFAAAMALLLLALVRAFQEYPQPRIGTVVLFGVGLGLTIGTRIIGGMAALYAAAALLLVVTAEARTSSVGIAAGRAGRFIAWLLPGLVIGYLVMGVVWPWSVVNPLNPWHALEYFSEFFEKPWREVFAGQLVQVTDMPRTYLLTLLALQMPEVFVALATAGAILAFVNAARRDIAVPARAALMLVATAAALPIAITVVTRPAMYNGIRHFMFVVPPLAVLGGFAGARLLDWAAQRGRAALVAASAVLAVAFAPPVVELVRLHPYQYTYFNGVAGGVAGADGRYMLDFWGLSFKQAGAALRAALVERNEKPPGRPWKMALCGPRPPARIALGPDFELSWDPAGADFALLLGTFYCAKFDAPLLAQVEREGVVYARAYDIRGRSFSTLFTLPPVQ